MKTNVRKSRAGLESFAMGTIAVGHRAIFIDAGKSRAAASQTNLTEPSHPPTTPATPPLQPGPTFGRSTWPTVLGTIAIIFGAGGILSGAWALVAPTVMEALVSSGPGSPPESLREMLDVMSAWRVWTTLLALLGVGAAGLLLAAGVLLIKRRRKAISALRIWGVLKISLAVAGSAFGLVLQDTLREVTEAPSMAFAEVMTVFGLLYGCALPVFCLIWIARERVKTEIRRWA